MSPRTLVLLRHGKSDWSGAEPDLERPLAGRGQRQAPQAGRWLAGHLAGMELAVVSPAERTRQTWELVAAELVDPPPVRLDDRLYAASGSELLEVVHDLPDGATTVLLLGHNPGMEHLVEALSGHGVPMPTSALAVLDIHGPWSSAGRSPAELRSWGRPPAE